MIDAALMRPGRFDKIIYVPPPDEKGRLEIMRIYTAKMELDKDTDLEYLSSDAISSNYTGADIQAVCREAAMNALREDMSASVVVYDR
jgi:SpoVK/Ycf46/Vps4 family AAA+-type ATPase